jgi:SAM-dependent methyltransferase
VTYRTDLQREVVGEALFDTIMINHVLEHVPDDRSALRNLYRMLRPGGLCLVTVPLRPNGLPTDEDPTVVDPKERGRRFGQPDHVRYYGLDIAERISAQGFATEVLYSAQADPEAVARYTMSNEILFLASRPN